MRLNNQKRLHIVGFDFEASPITWMRDLIFHSRSGATLTLHEVDRIGWLRIRHMRDRTTEKSTETLNERGSRSNGRTNGAMRRQLMSLRVHRLGCDRLIFGSKTKIVFSERRTGVEFRSRAIPSRCFRCRRQQSFSTRETPVVLWDMDYQSTGVQCIPIALYLFVREAVRHTAFHVSSWCDKNEAKVFHLVSVATQFVIIDRNRWHGPMASTRAKQISEILNPRT